MKLGVYMNEIMSLAPTVRESFPIRALRAVKHRLVSRASAASDRLRRVVTPVKLRNYDRVHLGSGPRQIPGWANLDIAGTGNLIWDLRKPLPLGRNTIRFVYTEHFIEHITREDAKKLLIHCRSAMAPDAVIRVSTPDLRELALRYVNGDLINVPHGGWYPKTLCQMVNEGMRMWGHTYVYDEEELCNLLTEAGFIDIKKVSWGESEHPELRGLETRPDFQDLIFEARSNR